MASKKFIFNIPNQYSTDSRWIEWHTALKTKFGKKSANELFTTAWQKYGGEDIRGNTSQLRTYLEKYGIELETGFLSDIKDFGDSAFDFVGDYVKVVKYVGYALGGMTIIFIGMVLYNVGKNPIEATKTAIAVKSGGL